MRIRHMAVAALVAAQAAAVLACTQAARADDKPVTLAYVQKTGDVWRQKMTLNISVAGMTLKLDTTSKNEVKEVKPDGTVVLDETAESGKITTPMGDQDIPVTTMTVTRDKFGKLVDVKRPESDQTPMAPEVQKIISMLSDPILSDKPVKTGDTWETSFDNPAVTGKQFKVKTAYLGTETVDGKDLWKVKQTATVPPAADATTPITYDTTYYMDPANGRIVKASMVMKNIPTTFGSPMDFDGQLSLVKPEKAAN